MTFKFAQPSEPIVASRGGCYTKEHAKSAARRAGTSPMNVQPNFSVVTYPRQKTVSDAIAAPQSCNICGLRFCVCTRPAA